MGGNPSRKLMLTRQHTGLQAVSGFKQQAVFGAALGIADQAGDEEQFDHRAFLSTIL
ncbi:hypothetical protein ACFP76_05915 [Paracoccus aerius]|uniref:hypothetical protein n=1 Tax=Paracoccus aerius TaxID=1915382 RepID=UPI00361FAF19